MAVRLSGAMGTWILPDGETLLGRGEACGVRVDDPRLSRQHARFVTDARQILVHDLGSANGVLVRGDRITAPTALRPGDTVVCGPVLLVVEVDGERPPARVSGDAVTGTLRALVGDKPLRSTEAMAQEDVERALRDASGGRAAAKVDAAIAAALAGAPPREGSTSIHPSEMEGISSTSALSPNRFHEPSPPSEPRRTTSILPSEAPEVGTAALVADPGHGSARGPRPSTRARLLAGVADPLAFLLLGLAVGGAVALAGTIGALAWSGAGVVGGRPVLPGAPPASIPALVQACLSPETWRGLGDLARQIRGPGAMGPFLLLFLSWAVGAVAVELILLIGLVAATVGRGGPWLHRRWGLVLLVRRNGHHPGWLRALWRWLLLGLTAPLAVATAACGVRGVHDRLSGCEIRRR